MTKKDGIKHLQCTLLDMNDMKEYTNYNEFAGLGYSNLYSFALSMSDLGLSKNTSAS